MSRIVNLKWIWLVCLFFLTTGVGFCSEDSQDSSSQKLERARQKWEELNPQQKQALREA